MWRRRGRRRRRWSLLVDILRLTPSIADALLTFQSPKGNHRRVANLWARSGSRILTSPSRKSSSWEQIRSNVV